MPSSRRRNPNVIVQTLTRSIATGQRVRVIFRDDAGSHDGVCVRKEVDPRRVVKDPKKQGQASSLIFTFEGGREVAVNSVENAVDLPEGY